MKNNRIILSILLLLCLSNTYAQDTTIIQTDKIKSNCFSKKGKGLYRTKNSVDSSGLKNCPNYDFSNIDFSKNDLISIVCTSGGCGYPDVNYTLYKISSEKKYLFVIKIKAKGYCKVNIPITIHELVPKLETEYTFEYVVKKII